MEIVAATNNKAKLDELRTFLESAGHTVRSMAEAGVNLVPEEDGETFAENAAIKATTVCRGCGMPTLGDDSGLCVDVLDGAPGVRSARFAGENADSAANNKKLMKLLERYPYARRGAHFVCSLALALPGGNVLEAEGSCDGLIGMAASGTGGFGYDSLFYQNNVSFADMPQEEKDRVSHRAQAMKKLLEQLPEFLALNGVAK